MQSRNNITEHIKQETYHALNTTSTQHNLLSHTVPVSSSSIKYLWYNCAIIATTTTTIKTSVMWMKSQWWKFTFYTACLPIPYCSGPSKQKRIHFMRSRQNQREHVQESGIQFWNFSSKVCRDFFKDHCEKKEVMCIHGASIQSTTAMIKLFPNCVNSVVDVLTMTSNSSPLVDTKWAAQYFK